jgi:hypothetical protein
MILNDSEYQQALDRLSAATTRLRDHEASMRERGFLPAEIKRALDPLRSFTVQLEEELEAYEGMQPGQRRATTTSRGPSGPGDGSRDDR